MLKKTDLYIKQNERLNYFYIFTFRNMVPEVWSYHLRIQRDYNIIFFLRNSFLLFS